MSESFTEQMLRERIQYMLRHLAKSPSSLAFSPDATFLAVGMPDNRILLFRVGNGELMNEWKAIPGLVQANRKYFEQKLEEEDGVMGLLALLTDALERITIRSLTFRPEGLQQGIAAAIGNGSAGFWSLQGKQIKMWEEGNSPITNITFNADGQIVAYRGWENITIRHLITGQVVQKIAIENHTISGQLFAMSHDSRYFAVSNAKNERRVAIYTASGENLEGISLYEAASYEEEESVRSSLFKDEIRTLAWSPASNLLAVGTTRGNIQVWLPIGEKRFSSIFKSGLDMKVEALAPTPEGFLALLVSEQELLLWQSGMNHIISLMRGDDISPEGVVASTFNTDHSQVAVGFRDGKVFIWNTSGQLVSSFQVPSTDLL